MSGILLIALVVLLMAWVADRIAKMIEQHL